MSSKVSGRYPEELCQYLTKPEVADKCMNFLSAALLVPYRVFDHLIEPAAGNGAFLAYFAKFDPEIRAKMAWMDIDSEDPATRADFLAADLRRFYGPTKITMVYGNPPYGKNSSLAIKFFNRASLFAAVVAFIVPRTFQKKSIHQRLNMDFHLVDEMPVDDDSFTIDGKSCTVPSVFQVWVKYDHAYMFASNPRVHAIRGPRIIEHDRMTTDDFHFIGVGSGAHFAIRRVGVNAGRIFTSDVESRSVQSHMFVKVNNEGEVARVLANLEALDLQHSVFKYMTAGNPSLGKGELCMLYNEKYTGIQN